MRFLTRSKFLYLLVYLLIAVAALVSVVVLARNRQDATSEAGTSGTTTTLTGTLGVIVNDNFDTRRTTYTYFLDTVTNGRTTTRNVNYTGTKALVPGGVKLTGTLNNNTLTVNDAGVIYTQTATTQNVRPANPITRKVAIVLLNWSDRTFPTEITNISTPDQVAAIFNNVEAYFSSESKGLVTLSNTSTDVYGWTTSNVPYNCATFGDYRTGNPVGSAATNAIPADRRSQYHHTIIVMPGCTASHATQSNTAGSARITANKFRLSVIEHELGHNYNAQHVGDLGNCPHSGLVDSGCSLVNDYGSWEPMGLGLLGNSHANSFSPYHKYVMGWMGADQAVNVRADTNNINVNTASVPTNQALELRVCRDKFSYYAVENRTPTGFDASLTSSIYGSNPHSGVIIRLVGTEAGRFPRGTWPNPNYMFNMGSYNPGQRLTDSSVGVEITVNSKSAGASGVANVSVNYTGNPPAECPVMFTGSIPPTTPPATVRDRDTVGVFRPSNGALYLKNSNTSGFADIEINYGIAGDYPVVGDWDRNGTTTIGIYRNATFYLRNSNTIGFADLAVPFGAVGDQPVAGDWDGDGRDTIGVYRNGTFMLRNSNTSGEPQMIFGLGIPGDVGIAGDWNGDGIDTTGVFRPSNGAIYLKNQNTTGFADVQINYGIAGDKPVVGDWNNDGVDTIGIYRNGTFFLRNTNTIGFADLTFGLGIPGDHPIAGDWDGLP